MSLKFGLGSWPFCLSASTRMFSYSPNLSASGQPQDLIAQPSPSATLAPSAGILQTGLLNPSWAIPDFSNLVNRKKLFIFFILKNVLPSIQQMRNKFDMKQERTMKQFTGFASILWWCSRPFSIDWWCHRSRSWMTLVRVDCRTINRTIPGTGGFLWKESPNSFCFQVITALFWISLKFPPSCSFFPSSYTIHLESGQDQLDQICVFAEWQL